MTPEDNGRKKVIREMEREAEGLLAQSGLHEMPDGTLMNNEEMAVDSSGEYEPQQEHGPSDNPMEPDIEDDEASEAQQEAIMAIAHSILKTREEAIQYRSNSGIERWWRISEQMLDYSQDLEMAPAMIDYAAGTAPVPNTGVRRSRVVMNLVRGRCEVSLGRFEDILLPVRDRNWGFKVTPNPEVMKMVGDLRMATSGGAPVMMTNGQQANMDQAAKAIKVKAEKAMVGMEKVVHDALAECSFNSEERKVMENAVNLGTGILKGPCISRKLKKVWKREQSANPKIENGPPVWVRNLEYKEDNKPISLSVSPWNVYPSADCKGDPSKGSYIWEKDTIRPRDVQRLIGLPGYSTKQLESVLEEEPKRIMVTYDQHGNYMKIQEENANLGEVYDLWEYNGEVRREYMELLGCTCPVGRPVSARIVFINDRPVKATLNLLDTGDLPYDFFTWTNISDVPWGAGEPIKIMWAQRIINAVWRQMCDNAGDSAGANIAIMGLEPDDGVWEISGKKLWRWDGETDLDDIRKAITQVQVENNQAPLQAMLELALKFIDLMTATPTIFQGEAKEAPDTLGATNIVVDSSNVTFRSKVKRWDDQVTTPHLRRWYDFEMQYHEDDSIKEDLDVDPRGASVLYEKDQMRQQILQIFQLKADPDINRKTDWDKAIELFYSASHLDIIKDQPAEGEQQPQGPPSPDQIQLQVAQVRADSLMQVAMLKQQQAEAEMAFKSTEADKERQHEAAMKQADLQIKMMEYAEKRNINLDNLRVQLALGGEGMNMQWKLANQGRQDSIQERQEGRQDSKEERAEEMNERRVERSENRVATPQVATPPTEPPGRAPVGEAYPR